MYSKIVWKINKSRTIVKVEKESTKLYANSEASVEYDLIADEDVGLLASDSVFIIANRNGHRYSQKLRYETNGITLADGTMVSGWKVVTNGAELKFDLQSGTAQIGYSFDIKRFSQLDLTTLMAEFPSSVDVVDVYPGSDYHPEVEPTDAEIIWDSITQLEEDIDTVNQKIGNLEDLDTEEKSNLVGAINEVNEKAEAYEGDIEALEERMTTAENDIDGLETRMTNAENDIDDLETAVSGKVNIQQGRSGYSSTVTNYGTYVSLKKDQSGLADAEVKVGSDTTGENRFQIKLKSKSPTASKEMIITPTNVTINGEEVATEDWVELQGYITNTVNDLVNYYKKSETYTQAEVNSLIASITKIEFVYVSVLPTASESTLNKIYLVPSASSTSQNIKDEYITIRSGSEGAYTYSWELIGSTAIDLSNYYTKDETKALYKGSEYISVDDGEEGTADEGKKVISLDETNLETEEPTEDSDKLITSGAVYDALSNIEGVTEIQLSGTSGTLTDAQFAKVQENPSAVVFSLGGRKFIHNEDATNYVSYSNVVYPTTDTQEIKVIYVNTSSEAVNYKHWNVETENPSADGIKAVVITLVSEQQSTGTLTQEQLDTLTENDNNYIETSYNGHNEKYYFNTEASEQGYRVYMHLEDESGIKAIKSFTITESVKTWVIVDTPLASKIYVDTQIGNIDTLLQDLDSGSGV